MKKKVYITACLAISAALFWFAFRRADLSALGASLADINPAPLILVPFTVFAELLIRGAKWSLLLAPAGRARPWDALRLEAAGLALNNVLPLRLGDIARGAFASSFFGINIAAIFATILAEKALDLAALFILSSGAAALSGIAPGAAGRGSLLLPAAVTLAAVLFAIKKGLHSPVLKRRPRLARTLDNLALGVKAFGSPASGAAICALALLQWFMNALNYYWLALAFGAENTVTLAKSVLLSFTGAAASSAPGIPGYFGGFELAVSAVLAAWGIGKEAALSYAAAVHISTYLVITSAGLFFIYQMGQSLGRIWAEFSDQKFLSNGSQSA